MTVWVGALLFSLHELLVGLSVGRCDDGWLVIGWFAGAIVSGWFAGWIVSWLVGLIVGLLVEVVFWFNCQFVDFLVERLFG